MRMRFIIVIVISSSIVIYCTPVEAEFVSGGISDSLLRQTDVCLGVCLDVHMFRGEEISVYSMAIGYMPC